MTTETEDLARAFLESIYGPCPRRACRAEEHWHARFGLLILWEKYKERNPGGAIPALTRGDEMSEETQAPSETPETQVPAEDSAQDGA